MMNKEKRIIESDKCERRAGVNILNEKVSPKKKNLFSKKENRDER